ncbi:ribonucleoprotein PTB-binding 2 isoform X3 [Pleurodeles waltl]|uniref:ribonucleoprotein PTB-binding 2 isoform X3 n=1 Tax=Pleurodeles waltl TaxID=8319 RepID=UPI003709688F
MAAAVACGAAAPPHYPPPPAPPERWGGGLDPEEISNRLQKTRWELCNRRKILIRNLPQDCSSQEVHKLLNDYERKYCYVDRNKGTAFVTLLDGEQAQDAIQKFHGSLLRDKEISVQLQPTDALLCVTNLPPSFTLQEFEELVRSYGNIERCFLVYNEVTGHSKGYGFVEYMKKDYAARARQELIGKQLQGFTLFAQWMDINQLTPCLIHSKCLCVDKLPKEYGDSEELTQIFSNLHPPVFCQLAKDEGSSFGGFAVIEYDTVEQAEEVIGATDGMIIGGHTVQISFCAPGSPGRSTLAARIAAQGMAPSNKKGLLPEPNPMEILKSLNNPAVMQMLLQPQLRAMGGKYAGMGASSILPQFLNASINPALLQLSKAHQKSSLGSPAVLLQNISHLQMAQQQLLKLKSTQTINNKPGLLGEAPTALLQSGLGIGPGQPVTDLAHLGETQKGNATPSAIQATKMGILPCFINQHGGAPLISGLPQEKQSSKLGFPEGSLQGSKAFQNFQNAATRSLLGEHNRQAPSKASNPSSGGSLLGEPPRDFRLSTNPFLNLSSVLTNSSLSTVASSRNHNAEHNTKIIGNAVDSPIPPGSTSHGAIENYYSQQYGDYTQEGAQQWYSQFPSTYDGSQEQQYEHQNANKELCPPGSDEYYNQVPTTAAYGDYNTYLHVMPSYYTGSQETYQPQAILQSSLQSASQNPLLMTTVRNEKRGSSYLLPTPESFPVGFADQQSQDGGENYADNFKRKRVF